MKTSFELKSEMIHKCLQRGAARENKRRIFRAFVQKTVTIINTGAASMGARDWDEETFINL